MSSPETKKRPVLEKYHVAAQRMHHDCRLRGYRLAVAARRDGGVQRIAAQGDRPVGRIAVGEVELPDIALQVAGISVVVAEIPVGIDQQRCRQPVLAADAGIEFLDQRAGGEIDDEQLCLLAGAVVTVAADGRPHAIVQAHDLGLAEYQSELGMRVFPQHVVGVE